MVDGDRHTVCGRGQVHPNLVQCIGLCVVPPDICMVSEYMSRGSLFSVLGK